MICQATIEFSGLSWLAPSLAALAVLAGALIWTTRRNAAEPWVSFTCAGLKLAGVIALILCLLEPLRISQRARPGANVFAVIADNSQSLQIKDEGQKLSRGESLRQMLTTDPEGWQAALEQDFQVRRYSFDTRLQGLKDFGELNFGGSASALVSSLRSAMDRWRGQPVAGVLLFTDGDATDLTGDLPPLEGCPPIYPVVLGEDSGLSDVSVDKISATQTAFEDAPVTVQAAVTAQGFAGSEIQAKVTEIATAAAIVSSTNAAQFPASLTMVSNVIAKQTQRATDSMSEMGFRFEIQPETMGLHFYQLEARAAEELKNGDAATKEATLVNNRRLVVVNRGQEPFRVLCVAGRIDPEYKFLNRALQDDPQVRMVTLLRIAPREPLFNFKGHGLASNPLFQGFGEATNEETARYDQPVIVRLNTKDAYELRGGFPKTAEELFKYDAVILDRVEASFFTHDQLLLMRRFVAERGGGFLMLGGAEDFREGGYADTEINAMLPVYLDKPAEVQLPPMFKFTLTREGFLQPWTRLRATEADEQQRLTDLPSVEVLNSVRDVKPGASVLATVSDAGNRTYPALAVQRFGFGSVAALMVGDLWQSTIGNETQQKDLAKTWRQLVRWLVSDVPPRFAVESQATDDPAQVRLVVKARDEEFKPMDNVSVHLIVRPVSLQSPSGVFSNAPADSKGVELTADPSSTQPGNFEATYVVRQAGAYAVDAVVNQPDGTVAGRAETGLTSDPAVDEFRSLKPNRALLETIARRTGGEIVNMQDLRRFVRNLPDRRAPVTETVSDPLWHQPIVFLFALGCFVMDWGLRRWKGLP